VSLKKIQFTSTQKCKNIEAILRGVLSDLSITAKYPTMDEPTINTSKLTIDISSIPVNEVMGLNIENENSLTIDYLGSLEGGKRKDIENHAINFSVDDYQFLIIDPITCYKLRFSNLIGIYKRNSPVKLTREILRVAQFDTVISRYLLDVEDTLLQMIDSGSIKESDARRKFINKVNYVISIAESRLGKKIYKEHGINTLRAIPERSSSYFLSEPSMNSFYDIRLHNSYGRMIGDKEYAKPKNNGLKTPF